MHICHVSAHLPPDQAANALLPVHLGRWAVQTGDTVEYVAFPPRALRSASPEALREAAAGLPGAVTWIPERAPATRVMRMTRLASLAHAFRIRRRAAAAVAAADIVHVHSNGILTETVAALAASRGTPCVLTLYGTEIWHYRRKRFAPDLFTRMYRRADRVTFYSQGLLDRACELGLDRPGLSVVYPPAAAQFVRASGQARESARRELGLTRRHILVNVKRQHPLAGQRFLIEAMPAVLAACPDTQLVFCGTGPLAADLQQQARALGLAPHVTFAGSIGNEKIASYYAAADLFVLPSLLEACPTVAVEALATGTPVVSSDNPGGVELARLFGDDVRVVPREDAGRLADAIVAGLAQPRRTRPSTDDVLAREFHADVAAARFARVYRDARGGSHGYHSRHQ